MTENEKTNGGNEEVVEVEPLKAKHQNTRPGEGGKYLIGCIGLLYNKAVKVVENGSDV